MAAIDGVVSRSTCQGLLRTVARPRARRRLLARTTRGISNEEHARPAKVSLFRPEDVREKDRWLLQGLREPFQTIDQESIVACKEPVKVVGSKIECLCSWNEASGYTQAIYVPGECLEIHISTRLLHEPRQTNRDIPGDASRPRNTRPSLSNATAHGALDPETSWSNRPYGYCNPGRGPRFVSWDDPLAALHATDPGLKLDHVDIMATDEVLLNLLVVARNESLVSFKGSIRKHLNNSAYNVLLVGNTLVLKRRASSFHGKARVPTGRRLNFGYYKISTESVPEVEDSSVHYQLLRYKLGPFSCLVRATVNGSMQDMPTCVGQSKKPQTRNVHGIDVIRAGKGVQTTQAFQATVRPLPIQHKLEARRLKKFALHLWVSGQTKLGIADIVSADRFGEPDNLTIIEMAELVRNFEDMEQGVLRRLVGLLEALRDAVRARGAPCVAIFFPPSATAREIPGKGDYAIQVYDAVPDETPVLLDWHKEHFWSQNKRHKRMIGP